MFGAALGLVPPWQVVSVEFDEMLGRLEIGLDFPKGSRFACPEPGCSNRACPVHDTMEKRLRHLDFFEHQAFLVAPRPPGGLRPPSRFKNPADRGHFPQEVTFHEGSDRQRSVPSIGTSL